MLNKTLQSIPDERLAAMRETYKSVSALARALRVPRTTLRERLAALTAAPAALTSVDSEEPDITVTGAHIVTGAQADIEPIPEFIANLRAYVKYLKADLHVVPFFYGTAVRDEDMTTPFRVISKCAGNKSALRVCTDIPINPTAVSPLTGLETYTQTDSALYIHPKIQLKSIATHKKTVPLKTVQTSGACTPYSYKSVSKTTKKAEFHHIIAATLIVEKDDGTVTTRQLIADEEKDYSFYDLDVFVSGGKVKKTKQSAAVVTLGDIHYEQADHDALRLASNLLQQTDPDHIIVHDVLDFVSRNHHNIGDHHFMYGTHVNPEKYPTVEDTMVLVMKFLCNLYAKHPKSKIVVVQSNHDNQLRSWLRDTDYRKDPLNAEYFLRAQLRLYEAIRMDEKINMVKWAVADAAYRLYGTRLPPEIIFLDEDDTYMVLGVEHALHGHLGSNGSRASPMQFTKMGPKTTTMHTHSPMIFDGSYVGGTLSKLDMGYNKGLSSWAQASVVEYLNGTRTIVFH